MSATTGDLMLLAIGVCGVLVALTLPGESLRSRLGPATIRWSRRI